MSPIQQVQRVWFSLCLLRGSPVASYLMVSATVPVSVVEPDVPVTVTV